MESRIFPKRVRIQMPFVLHSVLTIAFGVPADPKPPLPDLPRKIVKTRKLPTAPGLVGDVFPIDSAGAGIYEHNVGADALPLCFIFPRGLRCIPFRVGCVEFGLKSGEFALQPSKPAVAIFGNDFDALSPAGFLRIRIVTLLLDVRKEGGKSYRSREWKTDQTCGRGTRHILR